MLDAPVQWPKTVAPETIDRRLGSAETHYQDRRTHSGPASEFSIKSFTTCRPRDPQWVLDECWSRCGPLTLWLLAWVHGLLAAFGVILALLGPGVWSQTTSLGQVAPLYSLTAEVKRRLIFRNPAGCHESKDTGKLRVAEAKLASR
jgi:hypothetical protein